MCTWKIENYQLTSSQYQCLSSLRSHSSFFILQLSVFCLQRFPYFFALIFEHSQQIIKAHQSFRQTVRVGRGDGGGGWGREAQFIEAQLVDRVSTLRKDIDCVESVRTSNVPILQDKWGVGGGGIFGFGGGGTSGLGVGGTLSLSSFKLSLSIDLQFSPLLKFLQNDSHASPSSNRHLYSTDRRTSSSTSQAPIFTCFSFWFCSFLPYVYIRFLKPSSSFFLYILNICMRKHQFNSNSSISFNGRDPTCRLL